MKRDSEYRGVCADGRRKWRQTHPDYPRQWRAAHPDYMERNRQGQRERDRRRRLRRLVKNNAASPPNPILAQVWLLSDGSRDLVKNNAAFRQLRVVQPFGVAPWGVSRPVKNIRLAARADPATRASIKNG